MTLGPDQKQVLNAALKQRSRAELKALFALIRSHDDVALLAALASPKAKAQPKAKAPIKAKARHEVTIARNLERTLKPIMGPSSEKAQMLVEFMARKHRRKLSTAARGLADAAKHLRAHFTEAQIEAGAKGLLANLQKLYGDQETVV